MDLNNKRVVILGGSGLVGAAIARTMLKHRPSQIVLVALFSEEVETAAEALRPVAGDCEIVPEWGNVFQPADAARLPRNAMLADDDLRRLVISDLLDGFDDQILERSLLYQLLSKYQPDVVVDCINTATSFAYQDVVASARELMEAAERGAVDSAMVERHVLTLTMPQLIRHVQIALEAMRRAGTRSYVKIGTSGTGGMGLNIPYTHSEERPSRTLLTKSAVAGAQSLLLFLMARTPGAPAAKEIKPTAAIAWREIAHGAIRRAGKPIQRFDCAEALSLDEAFSGEVSWTDLGKPVESVFIDVGENGVFARDEFDTVTALGQMEFITPEEVADYVVMEIQGRPTGRDIVSALDSATAGPTYTAGALRSVALDRLTDLEEKHDIRSVAFEMLGPPRLTKLLYEGYIWSRLCESVKCLAEADPAEISTRAAQLLESDESIRSLIISIGLPILLPDGKIYRAETVLMMPEDGEIEGAVARGWVDLRLDNCATWVGRARQVVAQAEARAAAGDETGSHVDWHAQQPGDAIAPARFAKWIFRNEDDGERIKR